MTEAISNYWLDLAVADIVKQYPTGQIVLSSGISPSASYHIGHFREIMTADALTWGLRQAGREARHVHVVDNFDPLRKRYEFLPESYEQYVGWPICLVPDPFDACRDAHQTYAEHFYKEFESYALQMGIKPDEVVRGYENLYVNGKMANNIERSVERAPKIREIMKRISKRELPNEWLPLQLLGPNHSFTDLNYRSIDTAAKQITGVDEAGNSHLLDYTRGQVKLNWRLDWPARWQVLGVQVEPFSAQEHGAAGGSYETGAEFCREIFDCEPPIPGVRYANIHMQGDTKKMSSSKGNLVTPAEALAIMPPEILRYFIVRSRPDRTLYFETGQTLINLFDEFSSIEKAWRDHKPHEFMEAYLFATAAGKATQLKYVISSVTFTHLVAVCQAAQWDVDRILEILERTGYTEAINSEREVIVDEIGFVKNWLEKYAPESVKFAVSDRLPKVELTEEQKTFLASLAGSVEATDLDGQGMHEAIYAAATEAGLKPGQAFVALYRVILGQDSGPKAGWFLASLDRAWLVKRLRLQA